MINSKAAVWRRLLLTCTAIFAVSVPGLAQVSTDATKPADDSVVTLSKFEVTTTQDNGYVANNTASGFKTHESLMKIPQSVTVVSRDLIDDIGSSKSSDILQYAGASQFYRGESVRLRGARTLNPYLDDAIENVPYSDNVNIDSYEVIRGPAGVLYANAGVAGVVLKTSKKPLPYTRQTVDFSLSDTGLYRSQIDTTGPMGMVGDAKLSYRLTGAYQDGNTYFKNTKDKVFTVHPTFQVDFKNTTVRAALDYTELTGISGGQSFVLPNGKIYFGPDRDEGFYAPGGTEDHQQIRERVAILHRISDNWESKTGFTHLYYERGGSIVLPSQVDLASQTYNLRARRNYQRYDNWILSQDFIGKYNIGSIENQSAAGFTLTDEYNRAAYTNNAAFGIVKIPLANPQQVLANVIVPDINGYVPASSVGSWTNNRRSTYYISQQTTVIPDRLILVAGVSKATLQISDVRDVTARGAAGGTTVVSFDETLHRYGAVLNITKDIALYGLDSTTFAPQGNSNTRDYDGVLLPAQVGKSKEFGIKTALFDGKLSATISYFDMDLTNVAVLANALSPVTGISYFTATGVQTQKGWDSALTYAPIPEWQLIATAYKGTVKDENGNTVNNTYSALYSFFTRYDFSSGALKGFSMGGGGSKTVGNIFTSTGNYIFPVGVTPGPITLESVWNVTMFFSYKYDQHWSFRLNVANVLDKSYALGGMTPNFIDPSPPRTFTLSTNYKF